MKLTSDKNYKTFNFHFVIRSLLTTAFWRRDEADNVVKQKIVGKLLSEGRRNGKQIPSMMYCEYCTGNMSLPTHLQQFQVLALSWLCQQDANFLLLESEALMPGKWSLVKASHQEKMLVQEDPYLLTTTEQLEKHKEIWWNKDHRHVHFLSHGHRKYSPVMGLHELESRPLLEPSRHVDFQHTILVGYHEWQ